MATLTTGTIYERNNWFSENDDLLADFLCYWATLISTVVAWQSFQEKLDSESYIKMQKSQLLRFGEELGGSLLIFEQNNLKILDSIQAQHFRLDNWIQVLS